MPFGFALIVNHPINAADPMIPFISHVGFDLFLITVLLEKELASAGFPGTLFGKEFLKALDTADGNVWS